MDLQRRMMKRAVRIIIDKAFRDIQNGKDKDLRRNIRNLVDLGMHFAKGPNQRHFFNLALEVLSNPENPYNDLIGNAVKFIDLNTLKTAGINLGYGSFVYGVHTLRHEEPTLGHHIPWGVLLDLRKSGERALSTDRLLGLVAEGKGIGILFYLIYADAPEDIDFAVRLAQANGECTFLISAVPDIITEAFVLKAERCPNIMISVGVGENGAFDLGSENAFDLLRMHRCLYGFYAYYHSGNADNYLSEEYLSGMIGCGCFFGIFINDDKDGSKAEDRVYEFVRLVRGKNGRPILTFDWYRDMAWISNAVSCGCDLMKIDVSGEVAALNGRGKVDARDETLKEMIKTVMPGL